MKIKRIKFISSPKHVDTAGVLFIGHKAFIVLEGRRVLFGVVFSSKHVCRKDIDILTSGPNG